uniref:alpha-galactosidase n=2 Tax=Aegilops tauschii subsp. strangulata TaxID=200361 RepID=A0A453PJI0_AEGTS
MRMNTLLRSLQTLKELERPVILSISPGTEVTPALAENITQHVDMYRITGDDWDSWKDVRPHFDVARSFADANKITGLRGRSWPDLDMLPFGRLTDAGVNQGPHRSTNLTFDEQLTQMVLWSMAKSPLMYGGDLRHLNDDTFDLITHPTLLKINHHTKNNMEFGYIHSERTSERNEHSGRSDLTNNGGTVLGLATCNDKNTGGWHSSSKDHICRGFGIQNDNASFCMSKAKLLPTSDGVTMSGVEDQAKFHLVGIDTNDGCLDASVSPMFSTCEQHSKQVWELTENGQLKSSYSGLCATMKSSKEGESETTGARAWTATGDKGEIYLAFFNLDTASRKIAVRVPDLEKVAGQKLARKHLCTCTEVWSGKSRSLMKGDISEVVSAHGSILFEIQC